MQEAWVKLYKRAFWQRRRRLQLLNHPLCAFCEARGVFTPATVADHIELHKGDLEKFMRGALQSLCANCHNSAKKYIELGGYGNDIGDDGWPTDPRHPANRRARGQAPWR
jgi:5-methylcytosine-specific restriction endonuclease McrA